RAGRTGAARAAEEQAGDRGDADAGVDGGKPAADTGGGVRRLARGIRRSRRGDAVGGDVRGRSPIAGGADDGSRRSSSGSVAVDGGSIPHADDQGRRVNGAVAVAGGGGPVDRAVIARSA